MKGIGISGHMPAYSFVPCITDEVVTLISRRIMESQFRVALVDKAFACGELECIQKLRLSGRVRWDRNFRSTRNTLYSHDMLAVDDECFNQFVDGSDTL